ncbi:MAG: excisionase family DNA-binding protein [Xanthobacteraceae bacterium]
MTSQSQIFSASVEPPANEQLHDVKTIARRLNVSTKMVRGLIRHGELGFYRVGRLQRVSEGQYQQYLARVRHGLGP